jgi:hypothetical protein
MLLIARLRSDHPFGAVPLSYVESDGTFNLEGVGQITAGKVLDLENRRQLVWGVDEAIRERVLASAGARIRKDRDGAKRAAAAHAVAHAVAVVAGAVPDAGGAGTRPPGVPPTPTKFDVPGAITHEGGRIVWSESAVAEPGLDQTPGQAPPRRRRLWVSAIVAIACVAAVAYGLLSLGQVIHWPAVSGAAQTTHYTELYFTSPATLPTELSARKPNLISFTIFNREGHTRVYQYLVTVAGPRASSVVERGSVGIKDHAGAVRIVKVVPPGSHGTYLVTVTITDPLQTIHFTAHW